MFLITAVGMAIALIAILGGQALEGGALSSLVQPAAFLIVVGGTLGAVLVQSTPTCFLNALRMLRWLVSPPPDVTNREVAEWVAMAAAHQRQGPLEVEKLAERVQVPFMKKAAMLVVEGQTEEFIRERLHVELTIRDAQFKKATRVWESAAGYAPTIGILGSVIGLLQVMEHLTNPEQLGEGIAVAFVATVYGLVSANMFYLPIANKLKVLASQQILRDEMHVEAAVAMCKGESAQRIKERLSAFTETARPMIFQ